MTEEKITRRSYMKYAGVGVVAVAVIAAAGYYYTTTQKKPLAPLKFVHWHYRDDQITKYVNDFEAAYNEKVTQETLDNATFNTLIESKHMAGEIIDMHYANAFEAFRLNALGYLQDVEDWPEITTIKSEMYPSVIEAYSNADRKLQGLVYFVGTRSVVAVNDLVMEKAGMAGEVPKTWDEMYDMAKKIKDKGVVKYPILPHWFPTFYGIGWDIEAEMCNIYNDPDGTKTLFGNDFKPILGSEFKELLTKWVSAYKDGLFDPAILSMAGDDPMVTAFCTGSYAFNPTATYYLKTYNDPKASKILGTDGKGRCNLAPVPGLIDTGMYCRPKKTIDPDRQKRLIQWFGYKDDKGKHRTSIDWAIFDWLNSAYPSVLNEPAVKDSYRALLGDRTDDYLKTLDGILANMARPWIWKSPMCTEWQEYNGTVLPTIVTGSISIDEGIKKIVDHANESWKKYHQK